LKINIRILEIKGDKPAGNGIILVPGMQLERYSFLSIPAKEKALQNVSPEGLFVRNG